MSQRNKLCDNLPAEGPAEGKGRKASRVETAVACSRTGPVFPSLTPRHWAFPAVPCLTGLWPATLTRQKYLVTHVHGAIFKMGNQQRPAVQHKELCSVLCGSLDGRGFGGERVHTHAGLNPFTVCLKLSQRCLLTGYECVHVYEPIHPSTHPSIHLMLSAVPCIAVCHMCSRTVHFSIGT